MISEVKNTLDDLIALKNNKSKSFPRLMITIADLSNARNQQ